MLTCNAIPSPLRTDLKRHALAARRLLARADPAYRRLRIVGGREDLGWTAPASSIGFAAQVAQTAATGTGQSAPMRRCWPRPVDTSDSTRTSILAMRR